jgi:uncharacterized membrane protein SirB2
MLSTIHLIGVGLLFIALVLSGVGLFKTTETQQINPKLRKPFIGIQHLALTLLVLTGLVLLTQNNFQVETWFYAKIILFLVMVSSLIKAFKKDENILLAQRRAGWVIAVISFVAIYGLVIIQPTFG